MESATYPQVLLTHTNLLLSLQCNFNKDLCDKIFGERDMSDHLYPKWLNSNRNILNFFTRLDTRNQTLLLNWAINNIS